MKHPKLLFKDEKLLVAESGTVYMAGKEILITGKKNAIPLLNNQFQFFFTLSSASDEVWFRILMAEIGEFKPSVQGNALSITCIPANLEGRYAKVKEAIPRANRKYLEEFNRLKQKTIQEREQQERDREQKAQNEKSVLKAFDDLKL